MFSINPEDELRVPESLLAQIWKGQWLRRGALPSRDGRMVRTRSAGIKNKDSGPDFLGATIVFQDMGTASIKWD